MSCNPCKILVKPQTIGFSVDYLQGGAKPEYKVGGFTLSPEVTGINVRACELPPAPPGEIIVQTVMTVGITADSGTSDVIIPFNKQLDPVCDWETGVTITVNSVPVNILSVTAVGDSDPWSYTYEVDVTLDFAETIVWDYDAAVGDICALDGAILVDSTETTFATCPPAQTISSNVVWVAGAGAPTLAGAQWRANVPDASVNDPTASTIANVSSDTGKYYAEFSLCNHVGFIGDIFGYGWRRSDQLATNPTQQFMAGVWWFATNSVWRFNSDINSSNGVDFDVQPPFPVRGQVFGVALDCSANKLYLHYNGAWLTTGGGASGGDPSSGNGWAIVNPSNSVTLYSFCQSNNVVLQADTPKYLPAGYTEVT